MKQANLIIEENTKITSDIYLMKLAGDCSSIKNNGEFINISLDGYFLRRPISVFEFGPNYVKILYKVLGHGTKDMSTLKCGVVLDCFIGLGNGFSTKAYKKPLLVAGGIGIAPLVSLARYYNSLGIKATLLYGSAKASDLAFIDELKKISNLVICTDDGSLGYHGNTVSYLKENKVDFDHYYACGPLRMLEGLAGYSKLGEVSLEARMGCGFGACMGCSIKTTNGFKRVCKEGPVFEASEVIF
jgi:dihydroorotate dehydrogenase electron transfer subunit